MATWGCTMHRANYYQVVDIIGSKVFLGTTKTDFEATGYDAGYAILVGPTEKPELCKRAKLTAKGVKICSRRYKGKDEKGNEQYDEWAVGNSRWDYLYHVEPGHKEYTYGD